MRVLIIEKMIIKTTELVTKIITRVIIMTYKLDSTEKKETLT